MAFTQLNVVNFALRFLGSSKAVTDISSTTDPQAVAANTFWTLAMERFATDMNWPWVKETAALTEVDATYSDEWQYSYRYPSTALKIIRLVNDDRNPDAHGYEPFDTYVDSTGKLILTDLDDAEAEYVISPDIADIPAAAAEALAWKLAALMATSIVKEDPFGMQQRCEQMYLSKLSEAQAISANEVQLDPRPDPPSVKAR